MICSHVKNVHIPNGGANGGMMYCMCVGMAELHDAKTWSLSVPPLTIQIRAT
jgi:hypothetical protein